MHIANVTQARPNFRPIMGQFRPADLGQFAPYQTNSSLPREVAFRIVDENGYHVVNAGKKFPFVITNVVSADGRLLNAGPIKGTALSEEGSIVRVPLSVVGDPNNFALQDQPVDAVLTISGVNGSTQYPIIETRKVRFTVPPASAFPLDLEAIYAKYDADKYAAEQAVLDAQMLKNYQDGLASEAQAQAAADKAKAAAADAASKKAAADAAVMAAVNEQSSKNKTWWAIGGVAALGLVAYFAFEG